MANLQSLPWLILLLPLAAAAVITLLTRKQRMISALISIGAVVLGFIFSLILFIKGGLHPAAAEVSMAEPWLKVGNFTVDFGLRLDALSLLMLLIVTGVGSAIHIYSVGYMHEDRSFSRFFASLSLFTFSMLGIVLSNNLLLMFVFWELVGLSSYLLIGFWYEKPSAADAAKKAFLTNRIGDFGFLFGIIVIWTITGTMHFGSLQQALSQNPVLLGGLGTLAGLLIFCGAVGKSAQFPLHVWLPDAMEGPTPVSALIHAATMVAAGVFMLSRVFFIFTPDALTVIAWIGGITALLAALIAVQQNDIKRILAYSTLSQLGYMVMAVGLHKPDAAMFHLTTHAFFKALLFLGAGSVIHALHHEQNIWQMGDLKRRLPITFWTFLIGTLALSGVPPLAGFFSKDAILASAIDARSPSLFILAFLVAILTSFYMFRLVFIALLGPAKSDKPSHAHESPAVMTWPLLFLAGLTVVSGVIGIDAYIAQGIPGAHEVHYEGPLQALFAPFGHSPLAAMFGLFATVIGVSAAWALYGNKTSDPLPAKMQWLSSAMRHRFYFDEIYHLFIRMTHEALAALADAIDRWIIAGLLVKGAHGTTELFGRALRLVQTGSIQTYAFIFVAGLVLVLALVLLR
jgi:NADH-quinone oxidoreductase subunit L